MSSGTLEAVVDYYKGGKKPKLALNWLYKPCWACPFMVAAQLTCSCYYKCILNETELLTHICAQYIQHNSSPGRKHTQILGISILHKYFSILLSTSTTKVHFVTDTDCFMFQMCLVHKVCSLMLSSR